jgi:hypothetical protein
MTVEQISEAVKLQLSVLDITSSLGLAVVHCIQALDSVNIHTVCGSGQVFLSGLRTVLADGEANLVRLHELYLSRIGEVRDLEEILKEGNDDHEGD